MAGKLNAVASVPAPDRNPIAAGVAVAAASAVAFGLTIPVVSWAGDGVGPFVSATLLYAGAAIASAGQLLFVREPGLPLSRKSIGPLLAMALAGAVAAPSLFAWGLQRSGPVATGLVLNLEVVWTALLARLAFREHFGRRAKVAVGLMMLGGWALALRGADLFWVNSAGVAAVAAATLGWAIDNIVSRGLSQHRPLSVVAAKGLLGATVSGLIAVLVHAPLPSAWQAAALVGAGASGYGVSLRLYLLAQRQIGAGRTASVFALAPFVGSALGLVAETAPMGWMTVAAAVLFSVAVALHLFEKHAHSHRHEAQSHEHVHRHDDGHHDHFHADSANGEHSHLHAHSMREHSHEHGPDLHHGHSH